MTMTRKTETRKITRLDGWIEVFGFGYFFGFFRETSTRVG